MKSAIVFLPLLLCGCATFQRGTTMPWVEIESETVADVCVRLKIKTVPARAIERLADPNYCVTRCCWISGDAGKTVFLNFNAGAQDELAAKGAADFYDPGIVSVELKKSRITALITAKADPAVISRTGVMELKAEKMDSRDWPAQPRLEKAELPAAAGKSDYFAKRIDSADDPLVYEEAPAPAPKPAPKPAAAVPARTEPRDMETGDYAGFTKADVLAFARKNVEPLVLKEFETARRTASYTAGYVYREGSIDWKIRPEGGGSFKLFCNMFSESGKSADKMSASLFPCGTWSVSPATRRIVPLDGRAKKIWE
ncbi:MAG: hypothetical protein WCS77_08495 [Elusimicrobiaceae bacterium]